MEPARWPEEVGNVQNVFTCLLHLGVLSIVIQQKYSLAHNMTSLWRNHGGLLFANEKLKHFARDVFDTFATHAGLACNVTETD